MFQKKKPLNSSIRSRRPAPTVNESFRRNNVVVSKKQREIASRQQSVTQRQLEKKQQAARRKNRLLLIAFVLVVGVTFFFYKSRITTVTLSSNASSRLKQAEKLKYEQDILTEYKASSVFNQPWLTDHSVIISSLQKKYPEIERITFDTTFLSSSLKAEIRFRKAVFTWKDASNAEQFVDQNGVLFSENLDPTVNANKLISVEDQSGVVLEAGTPVLTENLIKLVGQIYGKVPQLYSKDSRVERIIIPRSTREVQIQVTNQPYFIKFNSFRNLDEQVGELKALLSHINAAGVVPSTYIDLRVAHKAFYK